MSDTVEFDECGPSRGNACRLRVVATNIGSAASRTLATSLATSSVASQILASALVAETRLAASTTLASAAQLQSCARVVLRIPLSVDARQRLLSLIEKYIETHPDVVDRLARLPAADQVLVAGLEGTVIATIASLAVQQALVSCLWLKSGDTDALVQQSLFATAAAVGSLSGNVVGAAVGTLFIPGVGTSIGSAIGGLIGSQATAYLIPAAPSKGSDGSASRDSECWNPTRALSIVELESEGDWIEISDASTKARFENQFDLLEECVTRHSSTMTALRIQEFSENDFAGSAAAAIVPSDEEVVIVLEPSVA